MLLEIFNKEFRINLVELCFRWKDWFKFFFIRF